eukprot:CAMPEP_0185779618 /NCGR_PEP_ID=MMETSP1174-20130828/96399_1 /TAXON_ID=35687 /ORGANISM="Dictyocha speculum, Strain CCMP1381" /LENGTH=162 /DNA_ID=CAMNT_0028468829 /DNA_START=45 /DNA_END=534 /DNA_ORIENTATION=+
MAAQGATLQNYNNDLVKCIEDLREKREEVNRTILSEEEEKAKIQKDLSILTDRLSKINEGLSRKVVARNEYDKTIQETEGAYMKILESSQTLLHVLKRETVNLTKKKQTSSEVMTDLALPEHTSEASLCDCLLKDFPGEAHYVYLVLTDSPASLYVFPGALT